ncbi:MAG: RNA polymerase sigma factor [Bacteroidota bacterium]
MSHENKYSRSPSETYDDDNIARLYYTHINDLYLWGQTFTCDRELIKDCIQDLFVWLLNNKGTFEAVRNQKVYLFQALRNNLLTCLKEKRLTIKADCRNDRNLITMCNQSPSIQELLEEKELGLRGKKLLNGILDSLSAPQKRIIQLRFYQQMGYDDICEILHLNYQSARTLIYRAIWRMRKAYRKSKHVD